MTLNKRKAWSMLNWSIAPVKAEEEEEEEEWTLLGYQCRDLPHADELHQQLMREIGRNVAEIQNEGLGEHALRDLNRQINTLLYDKRHWERRIVGLGGTKYSGKMIDLDGNIVDLPNPGFNCLGFGYFGAAAKKLPEVRELRKGRTLPNPGFNCLGFGYFCAAAKKLPEVRELRKGRTRNDIYKIDASYRDGVLEREEGPAEKKMRREGEEMRRVVKEMRGVAEEMRREAREEKKMELVSEGLLEEHSEAKDMLNIQG
ncbi:uncharacterized protein LOC133303646 [Gastrolobium bilobum]|uniref:uncharacterized protein LOC133303646 n=1 Tax=Gastrolobium bilobum TaxID=150636 RepID=UPI002AB165D0|nr:uncharacterized protein LOC133303646 [Gastrolobium bilobum]